MFYQDRKTQYAVRVDNPNPLDARMPQQALGGIGGESLNAVVAARRAHAVTDAVHELAGGDAPGAG